MTQKFLEIKKFSGKTLEDVLNFLKRDLSKGLQDAFAVLTQRSKDQRFSSFVSEDGAMGATAVIFRIGQLALPKGIHHITASACFDGLATSDRFTIAQLWLTRSDGVSAVPGDAIDGYNASNINAATTTDSGGDTDVHAYDVITLNCQWLLDLKQETTVFLQGRAFYSTGGSPTFNAAMVSHGYVME